MATKTTTYGCDLCDEAWGTKAEAEECESNHVLPMEMVIEPDILVEYKSHSHPYPGIVTITDKSNKWKAEYELYKLIAIKD